MLPNNHEADNLFQLALRTYLLSLSFTLGPSIIPPLVSQTIAGLHKHRHRHALPPSAFFKSLNRILKRELAFGSFAFSMTLAVAGGPLLKRYWTAWTDWKGFLDDLCDVVEGSDPRSVVEDCRGDDNGDNNEVTASPCAKTKAWFAERLRNFTHEQKTFISYALSSSIGVLLLQAGTRRSFKHSPTLDFTLLLLVRAVDLLVQSFIIQRSTLLITKNEHTHPLSNGYSKEPSKRGKEIRLCLRSRLDAVIFWACSAR
jgi:hypothetical protein